MKKLELTVLVVFLCVVGMLLVMSSFSDSAKMAGFSRTAKTPEFQQQQLANALEIETARTLAEVAKYAEMQVKADFEKAKFLRKIDKIPRTDEFWYFVRASLAGSVFVGVASIIVGLSWGVGSLIRKGDPEMLVQLAAVIRKVDPAEYRYLTAVERRKAVEARNIGKLPAHTQDDDVIDIIAAEQDHQFAALEITEGTIDVSRGNFVGWGKNGDAEYVENEELRALNVGGDYGSGKSNFMALRTCQTRLQGNYAMVIDLHGENEEGFLSRLGDVGTLSGVESCTDTQEVPLMLHRITAELERRLKMKSTKQEPRILVVFCEIIALAEDFPTVVKLQKRIVNEGRKAKIDMMADAQEWTFESLKSTGVRDCAKSFACHQMDAKKAALFMRKKPNGVDGLAPGQYYLRQKGKGETLLYAPLVSLAMMRDIALQCPALPSLPDMTDMPEARQERPENIIEGVPFGHQKSGSFNRFLH